MNQLQVAAPPHAPAAPAASPTASPINARTRLLLEGPIAATLLRLGAPNVIVNVILIAVTATIDAYFVAQLGPQALAGLALVFPLLMLMQQVANGTMGGALGGAVARAIGAGRRDHAAALAWHGVVIAAGMAAAFAAVLLTAGPAVYASMGGSGAALDAAIEYSNVMFAGAFVYWLLGALTSAVRGAGRAMVLAVVYVGAELLHIALTPVLVFGLGPVPPLGVAGAAAATLTSFGLAAVVLAWYVASGRIALPRPALRVERRHLATILRVGAPMSLEPVLRNLTLVLVTGYAASLGEADLAAFGVAVRLEYVQIPLIFGIGAGVLAMVGTSIGAGRPARAAQVAYVGGGLAVAATGVFTLLALLQPDLWIGLFSADAEVHAAAARYLGIVALTYPLLGIGATLGNCFQAAGRPFWPPVATILRTVVVAGGAWIVMRGLDGGLAGLAVVAAAGFAVFGGTLVLAFRAGAWLPRAATGTLAVVALALLGAGCTTPAVVDETPVAGRRVQAASIVSGGALPYRVDAYELVFAAPADGAARTRRAGVMVDLVNGHGPARGFVEWAGASDVPAVYIANGWARQRDVDGDRITAITLSLSHLPVPSGAPQHAEAPPAIRVLVNETTGGVTVTHRR